jgi:tetratricopeptide (TPR) repeat protein
VFTFGSLKGKKLEYVSYECPHHFSPAGHLADLEDIFAFLSGEIRIDQILKGKTLGEYFVQAVERVVSPQERREAGERLEQARQFLRDDDTVLALEKCHEAIELDPDSAEAHFTRGLLVILAGEDLQRALDDMRHAARLDPENPRYTLAAAEALWALGRDGGQRGYLEESLRYLRETVRSDPTNREALALRARVEVAAASASGEPAHEGDEVAPASEGQQEIGHHGGDLADEDQQDHHQV